MTVLHLWHTDLDAFESLLAEKFSQAPALLRLAPVIIDLQGVRDDANQLDLAGLLASLRAREMVPVALRNATEQQSTQALALGVGILSADRGRAAQERTPQVSKAEPVQAQPMVPETKVITQPVRSGQQVYAPGHLVILAPVSAGAEVIAEGSIHVYGPLRGRAIAGAKGEQSARIFCEQFDAELVAIAGCYQVRETMGEDHIGQRLQLRLDDSSIVIEAF